MIFVNELIFVLLIALSMIAGCIAFPFGWNSNDFRKICGPESNRLVHHIHFGESESEQLLSINLQLLSVILDLNWVCAEYDGPIRWL